LEGEFIIEASVTISADSSLELNAAEPIDPFDTLLQRILSKGDDFSQFAIVLKNPADTVLSFFPQHPLERHLHLIVQVLHAGG
jgi:hypothetical protein